MTTPQPQQGQKSISPTVNVEVTLNNTENTAFYSEPTFDSSPSMPAQLPSPSLETNMLDIQPTPEAPASPVLDKKTPGSSTPAEVTPAEVAPAKVTPPTLELTADIPTSPVAALAAPVMDSSIEASVEKVVDDSDIEMMDAKDESSNAVSSSEAKLVDATPKENGVQPQELDEKKQRNTIEELKILVANLQINLDESLQEKQSVEHELNRTRGAYYDLNRQYQELQQKMAKKDRDYEVMSKNYLEHVRLIRATDDDHSTIMDRLTQLKASIEHLIRKAQGGRSVNLNKEAAVKHFKDSGLLENFPVSEDKLEAYHLNLYMESVVMSTLVDCFFSKPLSCIFDYNKGFKEIYEWMKERNEKLAVRWRQQLCVMLTQSPATKIRQEEEVTIVAGKLSELMSNVYTNTNELSKIKDICNKAFELSIAMTALESVITPVTVELGTDFDEESMGTSLKSNPEGKVALVIFPAFKDEVNAFDVRPKVWCY
ncbi:hypothetical protein BGZ80_000380 [Entomortierella chlamydospora]|uniref:Uncharacterized protein n=1 Tax=Entomortierella chlamydospora TaxID=101097 RepID=A0A9P6MSA4_9FUNG|nr:hypothetical protein BGZ79_003203 [Entomortierella chlamydospora]KAG0011852.1 hypothetical protein BGZ80_000380 [Entomortierella chlamydospora]